MWSLYGRLSSEKRNHREDHHRDSSGKQASEYQQRLVLGSEYHG